MLESRFVSTITVGSIAANVLALNTPICNGSEVIVTVGSDTLLLAWQSLIAMIFHGVTVTTENVRLSPSAQGARSLTYQLLKFPRSYGTQKLGVVRASVLLVQILPAI